MFFNIKILNLFWQLAREVIVLVNCIKNPKICHGRWAKDVYIASIWMSECLFDIFVFCGKLSICTITSSVCCWLQNCVSALRARCSMCSLFVIIDLGHIAPDKLFILWSKNSWAVTQRVIALAVGWCVVRNPLLLICATNPHQLGCYFVQQYTDIAFHITVIHHQQHELKVLAFLCHIRPMGKFLAILLTLMQQSKKSSNNDR